MNYYTRIKASGRGAFPLDMLRFLQAWPATTEDAIALQRTFTVFGNTIRSVTIECEREGADLPHILARFESFGWRGEVVALDLQQDGYCGFCHRTDDVPRHEEDYCAHCLRGNLIVGMERREQDNPHQGDDDLTRATQQRGRG